MELDYNTNWKNRACPKYNCHKKPDCCGLKYVNIPAALGDDGASSKVAPKNGAYSNAIVVYEANQAVYIYSAEGIPTRIKEDNSA